MAHNPPDSTYFAVAAIERANTLVTDSDGDLWPSAWADDGALYAACGDGLGFSNGPWSDIVVNRIDGTPATGLTGTRLAAGREVAPIWGDPTVVNAKPTGMVAVDGDGDGRDELYLAVQDLGCGPAGSVFNESPAAGIVMSRDYGRTWTHTGPHFTDHTFTTVMFLDFGQSNSGAAVLDSVPGAGGANFVYAYGLDHNWRTSYSAIVPDPTDLYLARVRRDSITQRDQWEFFRGLGASGAPTWSREIGERVAVLHDETRRYVGVEVGERGGTVIAQGGIVYCAPLRRYLYTSWTEFTFEFYEAPAPWGPWRPFLREDFGVYPWQGPNSALASHGGYGTTIPAKFISPDGRDLWVQSNWFVSAGTYGGSTYGFSLRRLRLDPAADNPVPDEASAEEPATDERGALVNLADPATGARPIVRACRSGRIEVLNDGRDDAAEDSWTGRSKSEDFWGYTWPRPRRIGRIEFTHGPWNYCAGWFASQPSVQVRIAGQWQVVPARISPQYPCGSQAMAQRHYTFDIDPIVTDGVRIAGPPTTPESFTSVAEIAVYAPEVSP